MSGLIADASLYLQQFKHLAINFTGLSKDALHVYAALAIFISVRLIWRWRGGWALSWLATLAVALAVEWLDMRMEAVESNLQPDASHWHDIWNSMVWPTVLMLVGPWLQPRSTAARDAPSGDLADQAFEQPTAI